MKHLLHQWRAVGVILLFAFVASLASPLTALAGTVGTIAGTVTDSSTGAPIANVKVAAASPSGNKSTTSDANGFYTIQGLLPDTYTLSFQAAGYEPVSVQGITVQQDITARQDQRLGRTLKTIATVHTSGSSNLVKPNETTDVYTVAGAQLNAVVGGDNLHKTLYEYMQGTPGVTANGYPAQPRIRGGQVTDLGYEFDGIPIQDRITGFFTTNLSNIGIGNIEIYTGGLSAENSANGTGVINSIVKAGTYPAFATASFGVTTPESNHYATLEYGGATPNHRLSYYLAFDGVNSQNNYSYGNPTFLNVLYGGFNGPGIVKTRDIIGNFHYTPNDKNDFQFLVQNGIGDFIFNYLTARAPGEPPLLSLAPCPGSTVDPTGNSPTGNVGGTAPNGQPCPAGLYFGSVAGYGGNVWHHYSGIGKLQWNHNINDHSFFSMRLAENFNQYIFDQPLTDPNVPALQNPGGPYNVDPTCPLYPYAVGQPLATYIVRDRKGNPLYLASCTADVEDFYGDRRSNMYIGAIDYTNELSAKTTLKLGIGNERDNNVFSYYLRNYFNGDGSWPLNYLNSNYPTTISYAYIDPTFHLGKFVLEPGLRYQKEHYGFPNGGADQSILNPTFAGTYTFDPSNVVRFSYGDTSSFVGSGYIYRKGSGFYNPSRPGFSFSPQLNHSADLMLEHQFNPTTSLRIGPWYHSTSNYYELYRPVIGTKPDGTPIFAKGSIPSNAGRNHAFGVEMALNHIDNRSLGISYWLSATLDNYWSNSGGQAAFVNFPLPDNITNSGTLIRNPNNPPFSASLTADLHSGRFSMLPFIYYQVGSYYNVGRIGSCAGTPCINQPEQQAGGYFKVNTTFLERLGPGGNSAIGARFTNLTSTNHDPQPCYSGGTGCYPFNGPQSGISGPAGYIFQNTYVQNPFRVELFFTQKM